MMEERGLGQADVAPWFGSASRAAEVLNRRRALTLAMIKTLHKELRLPPELLLGLESKAV